MVRQDLINDIHNKQVLGQVIKKQLTDLVIEYNLEVSEQRVWAWEHEEKGNQGGVCTGGPVFCVISEQRSDL